MRFLRRLLGALVAVLSAVGMVCCAATIVVVWMFHQPTTAKVQNVAARLDEGFQRAAVATQNVQSALREARAGVAKVNKESTPLARGEDRNRRSSTVLRRMIRQQVGPNINNLSGRLSTLSDAATALSSLLQSFQEFPAGQTDLIEPDRLEDWTDQTKQLSATLRRLESVVGDGNQEGSGKDVADACNAVELALQRCQTKVDEWQARLEAAQAKTQHVTAEVLRWLTPGVIAVTVLGLWLALSQMSLFVHAVQWWRRA